MPWLPLLAILALTTAETWWATGNPTFSAPIKSNNASWWNDWRLALGGLGLFMSGSRKWRSLGFMLAAGSFASYGATYVIKRRSLAAATAHPSIPQAPPQAIPSSWGAPWGQQTAQSPYAHVAY